jgi:hypothetical protein
MNATTDDQPPSWQVVFLDLSDCAPDCFYCIVPETD